MRNLGLDIRNKIAKQKFVGHTKGCVVPHELMEEWAKLADDLVKDNVVLDNVTPRLIFDEGIKYANELAEKEDKDVDLAVIGMIAKDYTRHVAHYIRNNVG